MIKCIYPSGHSAQLRHVTVTGIVIRHDEILLVHRSANSFHAPNLWALPGGYLERDETTSEGVLREVYEETGFRSQIEKLFLLTDDPQRTADGMQNIDFIFLLIPLAQEKSPDHEIHHIAWFKFGHIPQKDDFAFDHHSVIQRYLEYRKSPQPLPIVVSQV